MKFIIFIFLFFQSVFCVAQNEDEKYNLLPNLSYIGSNETDCYAVSRCKLDLYYPCNKNNYPTVIWFHGGGLTSGEKYIPEELKEKGIAVVTVNYRLSPKVKHPCYVEDAAMAIKWVYDNIHRYGGTTAKLFVAGHSAGGWLTTMLSLNKDYLKKWHIDSDSIAGWFSISGQMVTHSTVRSEVGMDGVIPFLDEYAPCLNIRKMNSLLVLITGDRAMELSSRYEENLYFYSLMKNLGNKNIEIGCIRFRLGTRNDIECRHTYELYRRDFRLGGGNFVLFIARTENGRSHGCRIVKKFHLDSLLNCYTFFGRPATRSNEFNRQPQLSSLTERNYSHYTKLFTLHHTISFINDIQS